MNAREDLRLRIACRQASCCEGDERKAQQEVSHRLGPELNSPVVADDRAVAAADDTEAVVADGNRVAAAVAGDRRDDRSLAAGAGCKPKGC